ncbi:hypothetical protein Tco_1081687 [Tanacetum coccineum]|uniref:No apical meristem-associated C-terminal domain-containing protein n=1 Tax=Tanacetum coccineum TaxID=301880 RepID=A0ABQ5I0C5_9ASTR
MPHMSKDHNLWDVIVNEDLEEEPTPTGETSAPPALKTAKQLAAKRNQERVKSILLLAIPDEYLLLKFHNVSKMPTLWAAIKNKWSNDEKSEETRKGSNDKWQENATSMNLRAQGTGGSKMVLGGL